MFPISFANSFQKSLQRFKQLAKILNSRHYASSEDPRVTVSSTKIKNRKFS